jgi:hypothetical protein
MNQLNVQLAGRDVLVLSIVWSDMRAGFTHVHAVILLGHPSLHAALSFNHLCPSHLPPSAEHYCRHHCSTKYGMCIYKSRLCVCKEYVYIYVAIHALASMPSAPRLSEADSKTSTEVPCLYALRMPQAFCKNIAIALDTSTVCVCSRRQ